MATNCKKYIGLIVILYLIGVMGMQIRYTFFSNNYVESKVQSDTHVSASESRIFSNENTKRKFVSKFPSKSYDGKNGRTGILQQNKTTDAVHHIYPYLLDTTEKELDGRAGKKDMSNSDFYVEIGKLSLTERIKYILNSSETCIGNISLKSYPLPKTLLVCGNIETNTAQIILFTTMYYSGPEKIFIFRNVIDEWISLGKSVQPVLFLSDSSLNQDEGFIEHACDIGWVVMRVPLCNKYGFPVLRAFVNTMQRSFPNSLWIGYSNGDILFDTGLVRTLEYLQQQPVTKFIFVVGQRHDVYLYGNYTVRNETDFINLVGQDDLRGHHAIDYFITPTTGFPWEKIPPFVVGRSGFDNWLVWWSRKNKFPSVDVTESVKAVHQGVAGQSRKANSHLSRAKGFHANDPYMKGCDIGVGRTQCLKYKTQDLYNNPHIQWPLKHWSKTAKSDLPQMLNYTMQTAVLRILLENGYNHTMLYDQDVRLIMNNLNLTHYAFEGQLYSQWLELQNETIQESVQLNSSDNDDLQKAKSKLPFINETNVLGILNEHTYQTNVTAEAQRNLKRDSQLILLERTRYPRHCKNLHNPLLIQVKVLHYQR